MIELGPMTSGQVVFLCMFFYGAMFLIKDSTILRKPREVVCKIAFIDALLSCRFCTGVWVGGLWGAWKAYYLKFGVADSVSGNPGKTSSGNNSDGKDDTWRYWFLGIFNLK